MELRKDWSLAYFLLYMCQISYWMIILGVVVELVIPTAFFSNDYTVIDDIPVNIELQQFEEYNDFKVTNAYLNIPERMSTEIQVSGPYEDVSSAFLFYNGLKLYEYAVFFILFFMLAKILRNVAKGDPFHSKNASYLSVTGITLFVSGCLNIAFQFLNMGHFFHLPLLESLNLPDDIKINSLDMFGENFILAGIFIIILGYVFKEGTRIYEEQKLTV